MTLTWARRETASAQWRQFRWGRGLCWTVQSPVVGDDAVRSAYLEVGMTFQLLARQLGSYFRRCLPEALSCCYRGHTQRELSSRDVCHPTRHVSWLSVPGVVGGDNGHHVHPVAKMPVPYAPVAV